MGYAKYKRPLLVSKGLREPASASNPLGGITSSEIAPSVVQTAVVSLTSANLKGMYAAPVALLAAPGTGYAIVDVSAVFEMIATATGYANGGAVSIVYNGGSVPVHAGSVPAAVVTAGAGTTLTNLGAAVATNGTTVAENKGLDITNASAAFITGTGTAKVFLKYRVIAL